MKQKIVYDPQGFIVLNDTEWSWDSKLLIKKGEGHDWKGRVDDTKALADWFDIYLK